jgi:hypothetical protein
MKRLPIVILLVLFALAVSCAPAGAWYAPQPQTAYIDVAGPSTGWWEWGGRDHPTTKIAHATDPIPHGWNVVLTKTWLDSQTGVKLVPLAIRDTLSFKQVGGKWKLAALDPLKTVKYWSPPYQYDAAAYPNEWASDWWVPLGKLAKGTYAGWVRDMVPSAMPGWLDDSGAVLAEPVWLQPWDDTVQHKFTVK